jgi:hypothetical protein
MGIFSTSERSIPAFFRAQANARVPASYRSIPKPASSCHRDPGPGDHAQFVVVVPQLNSDLPVEREESVQLLALASLRFTQVADCPRLRCKCALLILSGLKKDERDARIPERSAASE